MEHLCCVWLSVNDVVAKLDPVGSKRLVTPPQKKVGRKEAGLVQRATRKVRQQRFATLNQDQVVMCCGEFDYAAADYSEQVIRIDSVRLGNL